LWRCAERGEGIDVQLQLLRETEEICHFLILRIFKTRLHKLSLGFVRSQDLLSSTIESEQLKAKTGPLLSGNPGTPCRLYVGPLVELAQSTIL
jgi:hypothetical protein